MELIRTDLNKAGWLFRHPDIQSGFPEAWLRYCPTMYGTLGVALKLDDDLADEDFEVQVNLNQEPAMALDDSLIHYLEINTGNDDNAIVWLLFCENHFIGQFTRYSHDAVVVELVQASLWEKIAHGSGFNQVKAELIDSHAPYDPKIYLTPTQHAWAVIQSGIYDPYN